MPKEQRADLHERFADWLAGRRRRADRRVRGDPRLPPRTGVPVPNGARRGGRAERGRSPAERPSTSTRPRCGPTSADDLQRGEGVPRAERRALGRRRATERHSCCWPSSSTSSRSIRERSTPRPARRALARTLGDRRLGAPGGAPADHQPGPGRPGADDRRSLTRRSTAALEEAERLGDVELRDRALLVAGAASPSSRGGPRETVEILDDLMDGRRPCPGGRGSRSRRSSASAPTSARSRSTRRSPRSSARRHPPGRQPERRGPGSPGHGRGCSGWPAASRRRTRRSTDRAARVRGARDPEFGDRHEPGHRRRRCGSRDASTRRRRVFREMHEVYESIGETGFNSTICGLLALTLCDLGRYDEADAFAEKSRALAAEDDFASQAALADGEGAGARGVRGVRGGAPARGRGGRDHGGHRLPRLAGRRTRGRGARSSRRRAAATTRARRSRRRSPATSGRGTSSPRPVSVPRSRASPATEPRRIRPSRLLGSRR